MKGTTREGWYFYRGCSRYMTSDKSYMRNVNSCMKNQVIFGDEAKGHVIGKGQLISISQPDQGMIVNFSKNGWSVVSKDSSVMMEGIISLNNCYLWDAHSSSPSPACIVSKQIRRHRCMVRKTWAPESRKAYP